MNNGTVTVTRTGDACDIHVEGRATLDCAPILRNFPLEPRSGLKTLSIDLGGCTWMDSTFMGTLASLALAAKRQGVATCVANANEDNVRRLKELGIAKLFSFTSRERAAAPAAAAPAAAAPVGLAEKGQAILEAHETLMDVDAANVQRFKAVVDMVRADLGGGKAGPAKPEQ